MNKRISTRTKVAIGVLAIYVLIALCSKLSLINTVWNKEVGDSYMAPCYKFWLGTDIFGINVKAKLIKGMENAVLIGLIVSIISIIIGSILGLISSYLGGYIDYIIVWLYSTISSIPSILLFIAITLVLGKGLMAMFVALTSCLWIDVCRRVRAETMKIQNEDYIQAAIAIGASPMRIIVRHILPNIKHITLIQFSLVFQEAVLTEILLSFLGIGVQDSTSWGIMINDAKQEIMKGVWWQMFYTTVTISFILFALNTIIRELQENE